MEKQTQSSIHERTILSHSVLYSFALYFQMVVRLFGGIVVAKFLGPALYGLRNAFNLALDYESYSSLGTFAAMNRTAPYYRGGAEEEKAKRIESSVFTVNFCYALIVGAILLLLALYFKVSQRSGKYIDVVFFLGLIIISNKLKEFYWTKLKIDKQFAFLSRVEILCGLTMTVISVVFVYYWGLRGVLLGVFVSDLLAIIYIISNIRYIPVLGVAWQIFGEMVKIGFPMMVVFFLLTVLRSADRIVILAMLSEEALGFFGIATVATEIIAIIPNAIYSVTLQPLMEKLGKTRDPQQIKNYLIEPTILIAYFLPFLMAGLYLAIHLPIEYFLTQYLTAIPVVKILTLGLFFHAVAMLPLSVSFALNKQLRVIYIVLPVAMLKFVLNYAFIRLGWGLEGVAMGSGVAYFVFGTLMIWYTFRQFSIPSSDYLKFFLLIYTPFLYTLILLLALDKFSFFMPSGFWNDVVLTIISIAIFFLLYLLVFVFVRKHSAIVKLIDILPPLKRLIPEKLTARFFDNN
jgi:O-antigen/teichoic acid export membrane protein